MIDSVEHDTKINYNEDKDLEMALLNSLKEETPIPTQISTQNQVSNVMATYFSNFEVENNKPLFDHLGNAIRISVKDSCEFKSCQKSLNSFGFMEKNVDPFNNFRNNFQKTGFNKTSSENNLNKKITEIVETELPKQIELSNQNKFVIEKECIICTCITETIDNTCCSSCKKHICKYCYNSSKPYCEECYTKIKICSKCTVILKENEIYKCACFVPQISFLNNSTNPNTFYKKEIFCGDCAYDVVCEICKIYYNSTNYYTCQSCKERKHRQNGKIYFCECNSPAISTTSYPELFLCNECDKDYQVTCPCCCGTFNDIKTEFEKDEFRECKIPKSLYDACMTKYGYFYSSDSCNADLKRINNTSRINSSIGEKLGEAKEQELVQINGYTCV